LGTAVEQFLAAKRHARLPANSNKALSNTINSK